MSNKKLIKLVLFILFLYLMFLESMGSESENLSVLYKKGSINLEVKMEINDDSFPDNVYFNEISDFAISENNYLFVSDIGDNNIKILDKNGLYKTSFGQKGSGPGDLYWPDKLFIFKDRVYVWEIGNKRFSIFSKEGEFLNTLKTDSIKNVVGFELLQNRRLLVEHEEHVGENPLFHDCLINLYSNDLQVKKRIFKLRVKRRVTLTKPMKITISFPYNKDVSWCGFENDILIGFQGKRSLQMYSQTGKMREFINHTFENTEITKADKERILNQFKIVGPSGIRETPKFIKEKIKFPNKRPFFGRVVVDSEKNILVFPYKIDLVEYYQWFEVFNKNGDFIKKVKISPKIKVPLKIIFKDKTIFCLTLNSDDELTIIAYKIY